MKLTSLALPWQGGLIAQTALALPPVSETFPAQHPAVVREMVSVSHGNLQRVKELVEAHPSLVKASWDWGFGDHETALGAASHVGSRPVAEYLIEHGAPPTIFSATMLGQLDVVKALIAANPGVEHLAGPHSIPLLAHAKFGGAGAAPVYEYLKSFGLPEQAASAPMSDDEAAALAGTYVFGVGPADKIEVTAAKGRLTFTRPGTFGRGLMHLGDRVFHPSGAPAVRIKFSEGTVTVWDPDLVLTAKRG